MYSLPPKDDVPTVNVECDDDFEEQGISCCPLNKYESEVKLSQKVFLEEQERFERERLEASLYNTIGILSGQSA